MSFGKKLNKLKRDPQKFFKDMKIFKKVEPKKVEPSVIAKVNIFDHDLEVTHFKKKVINSSLGYSTLFITADSGDYLINKRVIGEIIRNKDFIALREKSIYYILEKDFREYGIYDNSKIFNIFLRNKILRSNLFSEFRNIVVHNPSTETFVFFRNTNPFLKTICMVDSQESLNFLKNHVKSIDVLIILEYFDLSEFNSVPRIIKIETDIVHFKVKKNKYGLKPFVNTYSQIIDSADKKFVNALKIALIDTSYKKDFNLFLPIVCHTDNLPNIDEYNKDMTIQGLVKYRYKSKNKIKHNNFMAMIDNIIIEELYLRDNLYSLYKDLILLSTYKNNYKALLIRTLEDGVNYEAI